MLPVILNYLDKEYKMSTEMETVQVAELTSCHCGSHRVYISPEARRDGLFRGACIECGIETAAVPRGKVDAVWNALQDTLVELV